MRDPPGRAWAALALALVCAACTEGADGMAGDRIGIYRVREVEAGLEVRSVPDQHPWLGRLLGTFDSTWGRAGAPFVRVSRERILERRFWGGEHHWSAGEVAEVAVRDQGRSLWRDKVPTLARPWRVLLLDRHGEPLRRSFRLEREADARALAARLRAALGREGAGSAGGEGDSLAKPMA